MSAPTVGLTEETRARARQIVARYPRPRSALLPLLHLVQAEEGYVSPAGVGFCAELLGLTKAEVGAVVTFYTMYKRRPAGEYLVSVCTNTLCGMLGGDEIYADLSERLGVGHDETTADGMITLEHTECLAACDYAPVLTVNYEFFDQQSPDSALGIVRELREGRRPLPSRGAPLCTFREISRQLAGFPDERPDALAAGPAGEPTLVGARLAVSRGETAPPYPENGPADEGAAAVGGAGPSDAAGPANRPTTPAERSATAREGGRRDVTSAHDAPLQTVESDPATPDSGRPAPAAEAPTPTGTRRPASRRKGV